VTTFPRKLAIYQPQRKGHVPAGGGGSGQLSAPQYTTHTYTLNSDSTKHCFLPPKIAGEEMASKIPQTTVSGPFCTTSEFKAYDSPPVVY